MPTLFDCTTSAELKTALASGESLDARHPVTGETPLTQAVSMARWGVMRALLDAGADPTVTSKDGKTPLHLAAWRGEVAAINELIQAGAAVHARYDDDWTPLHDAAQAGKGTAVATLLTHGATVDAQDYEGRTALHLAAKAGNAECATRLLRAGASVRTHDKQDRTPLDYAKANGRNAVAAIIEGRIAKVPGAPHAAGTQEAYFTATYMTQGKSDEEFMRAIVAAQPQVLAPINPLVALNAGRWDLGIRLMLGDFPARFESLCARMSDREVADCSALHAATIARAPETVMARIKKANTRLMIEQYSGKPIEGVSPLWIDPKAVAMTFTGVPMTLGQIAAKWGDSQTLNLWLAAKGDPNARMPTDMSLLNQAIANQDRQCYDALVNHGAKVGMMDALAMTAPMLFLRGKVAEFSSRMENMGL